MEKLKDYNHTYEVYEIRKLHNNIIKQMYKVLKNKAVN